LDNKDAKLSILALFQTAENVLKADAKYCILILSYTYGHQLLGVASAYLQWHYLYLSMGETVATT